MPTMTTPKENILAATWTSAYVDSLPDSSFAWIDSSGGRHLPYKDKNGKVDLPHVRAALSRLNQVQGLSGSEADKVRTKLQNALKNAKGSDDVSIRTVHSLQADDSNQLPTRVMLLRSGEFDTQKYGKIPITADDIQEFHDNFKKGIGMPDEGQTGIPIDFAHQSHLNAGAWIKDMEVVKADDGNAELWGTDLEFSDSGRQAILGKEYKCISADFYPRSFGTWADAESGVLAQNVIVGAGFTNRPMFTGNKPVVASTEDDEGGTKTAILIKASESGKENDMNIDKLRVKAAEDVTGPEQRFLQAHYADLSEDERKKFELVAPVEAAADDKNKNTKVIKASEVTGEEGTVQVQASELKDIVDSNKKLGEKVESLESSYVKQDKEAIKADVLKHVKRGAIKADAVDFWVDEIASKDEAGREKVMAGLEGIADNPVLAKAQGGEGDDETGDKDARAELMNKALEKVQAAEADGKTLSMTDAKEQVRKENPELAAASAKQGKARVEASVAPSDEQFAAAGVNRG